MRVLTWIFVPRGAIWLIGERRETARDNGFAFFAHLRQQRPEDPVFYVIARDSPSAAAVAELGHVVWHSSLQHRILMLHAAVIANAYSIKHMLPSRWRPGAYMNQCAWRVGARRVYLKHGVHLSPDAVKRSNGGYDLVLTVGPQETQALARTSGYTSTQLRQTGLARYDNLVPERPSRKVLFMPTWRRYLVPKLFGAGDNALIGYEGSTYQQFVHGLLASPDLAEALEEHDLTMLVVPHYNLAGLLRPEHLGSERISILDGMTADIPCLLRSCALLVTDYSSVQFDVAYVGAPVIYTQFDRDEYAAGHGGTSWFDPDRDGFGPVVTTVHDAAEAVAAYAGQGFTREGTYTDRVSRVFSHSDHRNCARITAAIDSMG
ncbi:CDP-glycerol glycerophosphotransferase family protein [Ruania zhangjianzhongii]|uniref:CDP-glycerol glycerophosphotransferase family protein n=1 Tax=Ruania zhangjianzhongii TaxID=2603206 RepID=UPI00143D9D29|nr:CDP-glycerol glycerophosphotransferase family protein [Ruania zhangjianzhongii]